MNNTSKKLLTGITGAAMLLAAGCAQQAEPSGSPSADVAVETESRDYLLTATAAQAEGFTPVANVAGDFAFNQEVLSPADDVFSIFGTALTGMCAKPAYALENGQETHYVNVGGDIRKAYTVDLADLAEKEEQKVMACSCATGAAVAQANVKGVRLSDVIQLAEDAEEVNTVTVRGSDGYGLSLPLSYALEKEAMIVYSVNGEAVPSGTQLWVPATVAKYFTRDVVDIELTAESEVPAVEGADDAYRAKVDILNSAETAFALGDTITFEGYADDCGSPITAVEFSMDGGETWTVYDTEDTTAERWVYWTFSVTPDVPGNYKLTVRARTADGTTSPLGASIFFTVA